MVVDNDPADPARAPGTPRRRRPPRITTGPNPPPPSLPLPPGPDSGRGPMSRFVICPGNRRCPGRNQ
jgi:hypothetical protein